MSDSEARRRVIRVWDPLIRFFHWSLAATFFLNYLVTEDGEALHSWLGYFALLLLFVRLIWGFVGPDNARFRSFWPSPAGIAQHLKELARRQPPSHSGHNPVGGVMVLALLFGMLGLGVTGMLMEYVDLYFGEEWLEELHEGLANLLAVCVGIHVTAVLVLERWLGISFVRTMLSGNREVPTNLPR